MRYRLMVFDPALAPSTAAGFLAWTGTPTWTERSVSDPGTTMVSLFAYLGETQLRYASESTGRSQGTEGHVLIEHQVAKGMVHFQFETPDLRTLSGHLREMAARHGVGFFELGVGDGKPVAGRHSPRA